MENWHIDPISGMMISIAQDLGAHVAIPGRPIVEYKPNEVEHVTYGPKPRYTYTYGGPAAGNP
jgi:hypothetical protein